MVASMTGFGSHSLESERYSVLVEIKTVNGRFLNTNIRSPSSLGRYELDIEARIRASVTRGSVTLNVHWDRHDPKDLVTIDEGVARAYIDAFERLGIAQQNIAQLPGVIVSSAGREVPKALWDLIEQAVEAALAELQGMRDREGRELAGSIEELWAAIDREVCLIVGRIPAILSESHERLQKRLQALLGSTAVTMTQEMLAREVAVLADRSDITEEVTRLVAHLQQCREIVGQSGPVGRKLDFLAQEMLREVNTIGSKSSDTTIAKHVVELKTMVDRVKEQVANIE